MRKRILVFGGLRVNFTIIPFVLATVLPSTESAPSTLTLWGWIQQNATGILTVCAVVTLLIVVYCKFRKWILKCTQECRRGSENSTHELPMSTPVAHAVPVMEECRPMSVSVYM